ncbi:(deoxy)nucleoside triphosphate pyrophosphohydrolase [Lachnobacterium bovis]|uniref:8-oxo-dGTP diphosphatase n=1 Tax=Lachnobacterium bovis DSM 14045 TaxID=1122142 RepID=A0A1H3LGK4_9FIRM|nr:(deoxy)nucleoside triphosphate pyrophosphohydrolase [Lachnobacterium bovis]MBQ1802156.1 (deoxy)nucleoside triphosphate pyrophosphohydrolase [Lachnobacterium sp.]SDY63592.1 8-oxo-dGTP diphosphatase [Lachnobacterium bovis DSM 14045]
MKTINVVAAVIIAQNKENKKMIFSTQRGYGEFKGGWEFPGGKIEENEKPEEALVREIQEELDTIVEVGDFIDQIEYDYPNFHLSMKCYFCTVKKGNLVLREHQDAKWLTLNQLDDVEWLPADINLISKIREYCS